MNEYRKDLIHRIIVVALMIAVAVGMAFILRTYGGKKEEPKVLTTEQVKDAETVSREVKVSYPEAQTIVHEIERSSGSTPQITYYVQSPSVEKAAETTAAMIKESSPTLPKAVTQKSDRTVVTADSAAHKVDVYKINLNKAHKVKTGILFIDQKAYPSIGYQAGRFEGTLHFDGSSVKGGTIMYTAIQW
jgi:hypothetical protein